MNYGGGKILVTGGNGYIGSHTSIKLIEAGYSIVILDNLKNSSISVIDKIKSLTKKDFEFIHGDIRDKNVLKEIFKSNSISTVIHFAGLKAVGESEKRPLHYYENNVLGSITLFQEMEKANINNIVFSSSATVYGDPINPKCKESTSLNPINVYGKTKLNVEKILEDIYKANHNWRIINLRYFNPIGSHESGIIGDNPIGIPNNLMPFISQVAAGEREKLLVFGDDYKTPDGTGRRDYIHVEDLARGHLAALKKIEESDDLCVSINLGTGKSYSVFELIRYFEEVSGVKIPYEVTGRRKGDIAEVYADPSYANKFLNWKADYGLKKMIEDSWRWQKRMSSK